MNPQTLATVVSQFGTPCYVYDKTLIERNLSRFKSIPYSNKSIYFASMANDNPELLKLLRAADIGVFVNSMRHLAVAFESGFNPYGVIYTTTGISTKDMKLLVESGIRVNLDSINQVERYGQLSPGARIGVRLNIDENSRLNVFTGLESRIGISESEFPELNAVASRYGMKIIGTHVYLGTDITSLEEMIRGSRRTLELSNNFPDLEYVDLGGGFPVVLADKPPFDYVRYGELITETFNEYSTERGRSIELILEPGRALFGDTSVFCTSVLEVKERPDRYLVSCDASVSVFPRPMIYAEFHDIYVLGKDGEAPLPKPSDVVGSTTYSRDFLGKGLAFPQVKEGDTLVFLDAGSYCYSLITRFLGQNLPAEVLVEQNGDTRIIREPIVPEVVWKLQNSLA